MRKRFATCGLVVFGFAAMSLITGCDNGKQEREAAQAVAQARLDKLAALEEAVLVRDSMLNEMVEAFDKVDMNLEVIREKEKNLRELSEGEEVMGSRQDRIVRDIQVINTLMADNRKEIARLKKRLRNSGSDSQAIQARLDRMIADNEAKDGQIAELRELLLNREATLAGLNDTLSARDMQVTLQKDLIEQQMAVLEEQDKSLNEAFFTTGTFRELKTRGLVEKKGGLFGVIGGRHTQNAAMADSEEFIRIDQRDHKSIPVFAKKVELVTPHPDNSYELSRDEKGVVSTLNITDPEAFWESSRYLIVAID